MSQDHSNLILSQLKDLALSLGASESKLIPSREIVVREELALKCIDPGCENFGLSYSCPPFVGGPEAFRSLIDFNPSALVVRLIVPALMLLSWERMEVGRILHELVATIELKAKALGYKGSAAFAGDSCKKLFCDNHPSCQRVSSSAGCRHPDLARPSMSGFGVDVFRLVESCGWQTNLTQNGSGNREDQLSWVAGLVMIG